MMKPQLKDQKLQKLYCFCLYLFWGILILYALSILVITVISTVSGGMLSSPIWGLFALISTLPVVFPLVATFLFLRQLLAIKTNHLSPRRHRFEMTFAVVGYTLAWLTGVFTLLWLLGAYPLMYAAIASLLLLLLLPLVRHLLQKRYH
ncbi:MAG: hypothetical protein IKA06_06705 [Clostridia bacterium]|nr:hypothetical protein [Clostridia bacterium]